MVEEERYGGEVVGGERESLSRLVEGRGLIAPCVFVGLNFSHGSPDSILAGPPQTFPRTRKQRRTPSGSYVIAGRLGL